MMVKHYEKLWNIYIDVFAQIEHDGGSWEPNLRYSGGQHDTRIWINTEETENT